MDDRNQTPHPEHRLSRNPKKAIETTPVVESDILTEEPSELEVQQMLEARDLSNDPQGPLKASEPPDLPEPQQEPRPNPEGPHALDVAPIGSKVVVTDEGAVLATSFSVGKLPKTDPANKLPPGAKITKRADQVFDSWQLSPAEDHPLQTYATAGEAIRNFVNDFHPSGPH